MRDDETDFNSLLTALQSRPTEASKSSPPIDQAEIEAISSQPSASESPLSSLLASLPQNKAAEPAEAATSDETKAPEETETPATQSAAVSPAERANIPISAATPTRLNAMDAELVAAQEAANRNRLFAGLGRAASQVGGALAAVGSHGITAPTKPDVSQFEELQKTAESPVQDIIARRQAEAQNLKLQTDRVLSDPNSSISVQTRALFNKYMPGLKIPDDASAAHIQASGYGKIAEQLAAVDMKQKDLRMQRENKLEEARTKTQTSSYTKALENAANFRSDPSARQASLNILNGENALRLLKSKADLNQLTPQEVTLGINEIAKISTGGVPGKHGVELLLPKTVSSKLSQLVSEATNMPKGANAGAFLKRNQAYLEELLDVAKKNVNEHMEFAIRSHKEQMGEDLYQKAQEELKQHQLRMGTATSEDRKDILRQVMKANPGFTEEQAAKLLRRRLGELQ